MNTRYFEKGEAPEWFVYPEEFKLLAEMGILRFDPWFILEGPQLRERYDGMRKRFPARKLIPFARRGDNDDVACWEEGAPNKVLIVHDYASVGYEQRATFENFWEWFRSAIEDMIENNE